MSEHRDIVYPRPRSPSPSLPDSPDSPSDDEPSSYQELYETRRLAAQHFDKMQAEQMDYFVGAIGNHLNREEQEETEREEYALNPRVPNLDDLNNILINRAELDHLWNTDDGLLGDDFFAIHAENLVAKITLLVTSHFAQGPVAIPASVSPWGMKTGDAEDTALEQYAKRIARPDMVCERPWDHLLQNEDARLLLLMGIIMRMLDDHVFSRMLFGATPEQEQELQELDRTQLADDGKYTSPTYPGGSLTCDAGFARSRVRSATVNLMLLRNGGIPIHFWNRVDELTHSMAMQLLPVLSYVWMSKPNHSYTFKKFYQHLHHQVAFAGWWAVQVRRSYAIVTIKWPTPGDPWEDKMENVGSSIFEISQMQTDLVDQEAVAEGHKRPIRRARVLVVANPEIRRYVPQIRGYNDFRILRTFVGCYNGLFFDRDDERQFVHHGKEPKNFDTDLVQYSLTRRWIREEEERLARLALRRRQGLPVLLRILIVLFIRFVLVWATGTTERQLYDTWVAPQVARALQEASKRTAGGR
ncbi:hypothetical protein F5X68DRAFT_265739 [Plectosphaerella plurivora]|uniref:Uncharacterized protein n=1 Tax=Plectosphaerella plurivora TaxID=936078 RepID=A0A9P9A707_9PEZI|nr:hypothetical protein F5X68DRAFT_265739 [Plectosphaerella plurivora]